jgi:dihydrofolate synthase / folylpolyglutamate synthase
MKRSTEETEIIRYLSKHFNSVFFKEATRALGAPHVKQEWEKRFCLLCGFAQKLAASHEAFTYKSVVIGGTSGKGSTAYLLSSVLSESGKRVGVFISPHLQSLKERFLVLHNDDEKEKDFWNYLKQNTKDVKHVYPDLSYFEALFVLAAKWFTYCECDVVVWEAGCGGRWDATNAIPQKELVILTNVQLDHQDLLGHTREAIAREKAPLMSNSKGSILGEKDTPILNILKVEQEKYNSKNLDKTFDELEIQQARDGQIMMRSLDTGESFNTSMFGSGQVQNIECVAKAAWFFQVPLTQFIAAIKKINLQGRIEIIQKTPMVIVDIAHNPHKLENLFSVTSQWPARRRIALIAFSEGKDIQTMLNVIAAHVDEIWVSKYKEGQGRKCYEPELLKKYCEELSVKIPVNISLSLDQAIQAIQTKLQSVDQLIITGSTFMYREVKLFRPEE